MKQYRSPNKLSRFVDYVSKIDTLENKLQFIKAAITGHGTFVIDKQKIYVNSQSSLHAFIKIFIQREYSLELTFTPQTIIDAGANVGYASMFYKNKYPKSQIVAIEPEPNNFQFLKRNLRNFSGINLEEAGLWYKDTFLRIENSGTPDNLSFRVVETNIQTSRSIKAISIPTLMKKYGIGEIDLLKIDVEGSEYQLLTERFDIWMKNVKVIIVELHEDLHDDIYKIAFQRAKEFNFLTEEKGENLILFQEGTVESF